MMSYPFMQNAFIAGGFVAIVSAFVGVFVVARGMTFLTHVLSEIGFAGASFALFAGWSPLLGMMLFNIVATLSVGQLERRAKQTDLVTAAVSSIAIGLGVAFLTLSGKSGSGAMSILFGSIFSLSRSEVHMLVILSVVVLVIILLLLRPLRHFAFDAATADYTLAHPQGLTAVFTVIVAVVVAASAQAVGSLLIFVLVTLPAGAALRFGRSIWQMLAYAAVFAVGGMYLALVIAYWTNLPVSVYLALIEAGIYLISLAKK